MYSVLLRFVSLKWRRFFAALWGDQRQRLGGHRGRAKQVPEAAPKRERRLGEGGHRAKGDSSGPIERQGFATKALWWKQCTA